MHTANIALSSPVTSTPSVPVASAGRSILHSLGLGVFRRQARCRGLPAITRSDGAISARGSSHAGRRSNLSRAIQAQPPRCPHICRARDRQSGGVSGAKLRGNPQYLVWPCCPRHQRQSRADGRAGGGVPQRADDLAQAGGPTARHWWRCFRGGTSAGGRRRTFRWHWGSRSRRSFR